MGCWNETCCISNLPIVSNTGCRLVILTQNPYFEEENVSGGFCHTTSMWAPRALPIKGQYDSDAGTLKEFPKDLNYNLLFNSLNKTFVASDIILNNNNLFKLIERGLLKNQDYYSDHPTMIGQCFIREDIYQSLLQYSNTDLWLNVNFEFQKLEAKKYLQNCLELKNKIKSESDKQNFYASGEFFRRRKYIKINNHYLNKAERLPVNFNFIRKYNDFIEKVLLEENSEHRFQEFEQLLYSAVELLHIDTFMKSTRKHWSPQNGKGSQDQDVDGQIYLAQQIIESAKNFKND